jgi:hypothetical protein
MAAINAPGVRDPGSLAGCGASLLPDTTNCASTAPHHPQSGRRQDANANAIWQRTAPHPPAPRSRCRTRPLVQPLLQSCELQPCALRRQRAAGACWHSSLWAPQITRHRAAAAACNATTWLCGRLPERTAAWCARLWTEHPGGCVLLSAATESNCDTRHSAHVTQVNTQARRTQVHATH